MMRTWLAACVLAVGLLASPCAAPGAFADDKKAAAHDAHAGDHKDDPFKGNIDLSIWSMGVFLVLLFILSKLAWKPMIEGLDKREKNILNALEEAKRVKEDAAKMRLDLEKQMADAHDKVRAIIDEARSDAQKNADQMIVKAKADIQTERDRLRREIDVAKDQALRELWSQSAQLATLISAKAIKRSLSEEDHRRLVDESINDLQSARGNDVGASLRL